MAGYAVLDCETTGFRTSDRIIELAYVLVSETGQFEGQWATLVNPSRQVANSDIHGITDRDLVGSPTFKQLAPNLVRSLSGRTLVAHNASFDMRFLDQEMLRAGYVLPYRPPSLCTMKWSNRVFKVRKLALACAAAGIALDDAHEALADTRATAQLLIRLLDDVKNHPEWNSDAAESASFPWPEMPYRAAIDIKPRVPYRQIGFGPELVPAV